MKPAVFSLLLFVCSTASAQFNQLVLRKNGIPLIRFQEGSLITIKTRMGLNYSGTIYLIQNDSVFFNEEAIKVSDIAIVYKNPKRKARIIPMSNEEFLYANLGIPLFATILTLGGQNFLPSLAFGATLVYGPVLLYNVQRILFHKNRAYVIGNKYSLLTLDLYKAEKPPSKQ